MGPAAFWAQRDLFHQEVMAQSLVTALARVREREAERKHAEASKQREQEKIAAQMALTQSLNDPRRFELSDAARADEDAEDEDVLAYYPSSEGRQA